MGSLASSTRSRNISLGEIGRRKLRALGNALGLREALIVQALEVFSMMSEPWGSWAAGDSPVWRNDISDDGSPFEFSASFDGAAPKLRMLTEPQRSPISSTSSWAAGLSFGERLRANGLADLSLFGEIENLFTPTGVSRARFSLWHASVLEEAHPVLFKAYVNPCIQGSEAAPRVVEEALRRLGLGDAWHFLEPRLAPEFAAQLRYLSVDLAPADTARVKVYLACSKSAEAVQRLIMGADNAQPNDATNWLSTLTGSHGPFDARPILTCFSFRRNVERPDVTVHVPIRCYVEHDGEAASRVSSLLSAQDAKRLSRSLDAVSNRALDIGRGLLTYASLRREASVVRATVYLAPEVYGFTSRGESTPPSQDTTSGVHKTIPPMQRPDMDEVQESIERQSS